ncbi:helix-turn-helix domain-containing protein [Anianabacter salinae]|uniref:helix-turn-helix domain-containing protein n=1 Tax=Anianabacter salinae TaxID=2851023 RepID=UPI00225E3681|nr:helix-turn-helix domain-containing protein [Anianabacter salinae]
MTGSRIRERREVLGLKQAALAKAIGISPAYLNLIEHNRRRIGGRVLNDLARALGVDPSALTEGAEEALLEQLAAVAAGPDGETAEAIRSDDLATRFPGWTRTVVAQARRIEALERTVATLSDRLTHDPFLSESLHDVLSTVSAIRSTASILVETPDIEPEWRDRFQRNVFEESARLAEGARTLVGYLDAGAAEDASVNSPQEELEAWLAARGHWIAPLEEGSTTPEDLLNAPDAPGSQSARTLAASYLRRYAAEARQMPEAAFRAAIEDLGNDPAALARQFDMPLSAVLRRMAVILGDDAGLVICDGSGTLTHRKPLAGFALPRFGAACPLWPLYRVLGRPSAPLRARIALAGRQRLEFIAYAVCDASQPRSFDATPVFEAVMLLLPAAAGPEPQGDPVGISCRICPRTSCAARREPALIADTV